MSLALKLLKLSTVRGLSLMYDCNKQDPWDQGDGISEKSRFKEENVPPSLVSETLCAVAGL